MLTLPKGLAIVDSQILALEHAFPALPRLDDIDRCCLVRLPHYRIKRVFFPESCGPMVDSLARSFEYLAIKCIDKLYIGSVGPERRIEKYEMFLLGYRSFVCRAFNYRRSSPEQFFAWVNTQTYPLKPNDDLEYYYAKLLSEVLYGYV